MYVHAFKGVHSYELQIGSWVFQVRHNERSAKDWPGHIKRFNVWRDRTRS